MLYRTLNSTFPVAQNERADILDILRAFALLGICMANAGYFSLFIFQTAETRAAMPTAALDKWLGAAHFAFIDGKFYSLFSFLFGIGFSIILIKNKNAGINPFPIFYRRLFILLLFGLAHSFLLWDGDILMFYAIVGLFLPMFHKCSDRCLLILVVTLLFSPLLFDLLKVVSHGEWNMSNPFLNQAMALDKKAGISEKELENWVIKNNSYNDLLTWCRSGTWWGWQMRIDSNRIPKVLAMFLLGLYVGRNKIYSELSRNTELLKKIQLYGFLLGIPAGFAHAYFEFDGQKLPAPMGMYDTISYLLNVTPLSMAYAATIALWYNDGKFHSLLNALKPAGRMALTNYIIQSVICVSLYFGIGFGMGGRFGPSLFIPVAILIWIFQLLYSRWWFQYFRFGPLEWVWRMLTYGRKLPIIKNNNQAP